MLYVGFSKRIRINASQQDMEADPFSNRTRDKPIGPVQGALPQTAEVVVRRERNAPPPEYGRERGNATPAQLQRQGVLRRAVPSGL